MYEYLNEEVTWQRLKDLQREMENCRRMAEGIGQSLVTLRLLAQRAWLLAGLATRRPPRRRPSATEQEIEDARAAPDAA
jgi:hypothetical protein